MKIALCFAELHTPLFLAGINWGQKLDIKNTTKGKLALAYDRAEKELLVNANGKVAIIPTSNVVSMTPLEEATKVEREPPAVVPAKGRIKTQASTPMSHVFEGQGAGKTND